MQESSRGLAQLLAPLAEAAARRGLTATAWSALAQVRKETLSRLRNRETCDLATLDALAKVVGARVTVTFDSPSSPDGHFPGEVQRDYEEKLVDLVRSGNLDAQAWRALGPPFFMAGLAVMLASRSGADRRGLLQMAEKLHPGIGEPAVFSLWLARSPLRPSRLLPLVEAALQRAT